jgi:hypothetical protein
MSEGIAKDADATDDAPELAGRETNRNKVVHWLFVSGDRGLMVWGLSAVAVVIYYGLGLTDVIGVTSADLIASAFTSAITGVFTIVAVTISINQLVLSRVLGSPERIEERIDSVQEFRRRVEGMSDESSTSPTLPAGFLEVLLAVLRDRSRELEETYRGTHDGERREKVTELRKTLVTICDQVERDLPRDDLGLFRVLSPVLTNEFSRHLHTALEIRENSVDLNEAETEALDGVIEALEEMNITRHYFKTLFIHEELATVSRLILMSGMPAVLFSIGIILLYSADAVFLGESLLLVVVSVGFGVVLLPLNVLFAYGLRMGTIAKMTTTFGTFTPVEEMP